MIENNRVLFIEAVEFDHEAQTRYQSLGLGYLISSLKKRFGDDKYVFKVVSSNVEDEILRFSPSIVGISSVTQNFNKAIEFSKFAKSQGITTLVGGIHISTLPNSATMDMDFLILGEGEETICDLFAAFDNNCSDYKSIKGIAYWEDGKLVFTEQRKLIENLDTLPFPDRSYLHIQRHTYIFTSRGCPYRCVFCASSRYWDKVRFFSAEYVANEIKELVVKYNVNLISIFDDLFVADINRVEKLVAILEKMNLLGKIDFTCSCRANLVNERTVSALKKLGVKAISMGLESGNEKVLKYLKAGSVSVKDNFSAINLIRKHGMRASASFIIGSKDETLDQIMDTYKFIKASKLDIIDVNVLTPMPGTPVWEDALKTPGGAVSDNMDWSQLSINFVNNSDKAIIVSNVVSRDDLIRVYRKFYRLRQWKNIKAILSGHPYLKDIPRFILSVCRVKMHEIKKVFGEDVR